jgi:hypothetical protein
VLVTRAFVFSASLLLSTRGDVFSPRESNRAKDSPLTVGEFPIRELSRILCRTEDLGRTLFCLRGLRGQVPGTEAVMDVAKHERDGGGAIDPRVSGVPVQQVVKAAHDELRQLMRQRADIMKRIGTVKQTISGLANLFGDDVLGEDLLELIDRKPNGRQPGFTKACRIVLMEARGPLGAREVCQELERRAGDILVRHKDPMASVTTVLNRLVDYGEARSLTNDRGRRVWEWVSETDAPSNGVPLQASL